MTPITKEGSHTARKQARLKHAEKPSCRHQPAPVLNKPLTDHDQAEAEHAQRHYLRQRALHDSRGIHTPRMRFQLFHQHIGRNLEDDVGNEENGEGGVVLGAGFQMEVGFEPQNGRITDIHAAVG